METSIKRFTFTANGLEAVKPAGLQINQIFFLNGYGQSPGYHERLAIYEIEGDTYKYVNLDKPRKGIKESYEIRPVSELFGIGLYFHPDQFATDEEIKEALKLAEQAEERVRAAQVIANQVKAQNIERGKQLFNENKPADAVGVIIADFKKDKSDPQSDYFGSSVTRTVILAFTNKKRDDFNEMRRAAARCPIQEVNKFSVKPTKPEDANEYWSPEDEHREKYSMGAGYYLGDYKNSDGINISKRSYVNLENCQDLWEAAGMEDGFFAFKSETVEAKPNYEPIEIKPGTVQIVDYSEKAVAVIGDTKPIKEKLQQLGGKFNARLTCGAGWIFSKKRLEDLKTALHN